MDKRFTTKIPKEIEENKRWEIVGGRDGLIIKNEKMGIQAQYGLVLNERGEVSHCQTRIAITAPSAVIVPFMETPNALLIGVLKDVYRSTADGYFDELPRGYADFKKENFEDPMDAAIRELSEEDEGGLIIPKDRFTHLGGPFNMDTAWFSYSEGGGIHIYSCLVLESEVNSQRDIMLNGKNYKKLDFIPIKDIKFSCGVSQMAMATFIANYSNLL
ncbi:MAG: hypothetical protein WCG91_00580 [Candidatus Shapirobacteria bacterium]